LEVVEVRVVVVELEDDVLEVGGLVVVVLRVIEVGALDGPDLQKHR
jgi:hypothetical protein